MSGAGNRLRVPSPAMGTKRRISDVFNGEMVSSKSVAWTCLLVQLVLSCACLIASLAVICAKLQSTSIYHDRQDVSLEWWSFCVMSFLMIWATVFSMLGLSGHKRIFLCPHLLLLIAYSLFVGRVLLRVVLEFELSEFNWVIGVSVLSLAVSDVELYDIVAMAMDYQVVLMFEMVLLVLGITSVGILHGYTEGVGHHMREYYTPLWACAVLMCILLLLIISLALVFIWLHFNCPGIIKQHVMAIVVAWPLSLVIIVSAVVAGAPILVALVLIFFFSSLLPFAWLYANAKWSTEIEPPV